VAQKYDTLFALCDNTSHKHFKQADSLTRAVVPKHKNPPENIVITKHFYGSETKFTIRAGQRNTYKPFDFVLRSHILST
jgi:hypothetical protein